MARERDKNPILLPSKGNQSHSQNLGLHTCVLNYSHYLIISHHPPTKIFIMIRSLAWLKYEGKSRVNLECIYEQNNLYQLRLR